MIEDGSVSSQAVKEYEHKMQLANSNDYQYQGILYFGSRKESLNLLFDTGSSWTWVPTEDCPIM